MYIALNVCLVNIVCACAKNSLSWPRHAGTYMYVCILYGMSVWSILCVPRIVCVGGVYVYVCMGALYVCMYVWMYYMYVYMYKCIMYICMDELYEYVYVWIYYMNGCMYMFMYGCVTPPVQK